MSTIATRVATRWVTSSGVTEHVMDWIRAFDDARDPLHGSEEMSKRTEQIHVDALQEAKNLRQLADSLEVSGRTPFVPPRYRGMKSEELRELAASLTTLASQ